MQDDIFPYTEWHALEARQVVQFVPFQLSEHSQRLGDVQTPCAQPGQCGTHVLFVAAINPGLQVHENAGNPGSFVHVEFCVQLS
mmetsp:Transcript_24477/g.73307  ORF Transcript_24477/g.73307 Transcript_24477/m.73307 type:complete len:84 (-) Transcript_24477:4529-4780(-)